MARIAKDDVKRTLTILGRSTGLDLSAQIWAPGDGRTRYRLVINEGGGVRDLGPVFMSAAAFEDALRTTLDVVREMRTANLRKEG